MIYKLRFHQAALDEWQRLDGSVKMVFKKKLGERLEHPRMPASMLHGMKDCYKIKLRQWGYRLVYRVDDDTVWVTVISIGKRDGGNVYALAKGRLD